MWWFQRLRKLGASVTARDVLVTIASHSDKAGRAYPSIETIARELEISERAVKGAIPEIVTAGIMTSTARNRRAREANLYQLAIYGKPFQVKPVVPVIEGQSGEAILPAIRPDQVKLDARSGEVNGVHQGKSTVLKTVENQLTVIEPTREKINENDGEAEQVTHLDNNSSTYSWSSTYEEAIAQRSTERKGSRPSAIPSTVSNTIIKGLK